jgi:hypothetical protein
MPTVSKRTKRQQNGNGATLDSLQRQYLLTGRIWPGLSYANMREYRIPGGVRYKKLAVDCFDLEEGTTGPMHDYARHRDDLRAEAQRRFGREPFFEKIWNEKLDIEIFGED